MFEEKVVRLCREGSCCPAVVIGKEDVCIGEDENICTLTKDQWEILRDKILAGEL